MTNTKKDIIERIIDELKTRFEQNSWDEITLTMKPSGDKITIHPCFYDSTKNEATVEFFLLTLQQLKHVGFLYTFTFKYTRKHMRLMNFYKTFTTKDTIASISDSIRLMSKPICIFSFSNCDTT